jgi:hypothetical protein
VPNIGKVRKIYSRKCEINQQLTHKHTYSTKLSHGAGAHRLLEQQLTHLSVSVYRKLTVIVRSKPCLLSVLYLAGLLTSVY